MSTDFKSIPHANVFEALSTSHGLVLPAYEIARLTSALQGIHAITAVLQQRELDEEMEAGEGVTFGPNVAIGLLAALATCAELVQDAVETGGMSGERAGHGTPAYEALKSARSAVAQANQKEAGHG